MRSKSFGFRSLSSIGDLAVEPGRDLGKQSRLAVLADRRCTTIHDLTTIAQRAELRLRRFLAALGQPIDDLRRRASDVLNLVCDRLLSHADVHSCIWRHDARSSMVEVIGISENRLDDPFRWSQVFSVVRRHVVAPDRTKERGSNDHFRVGSDDLPSHPDSCGSSADVSTSQELMRNVEITDEDTAPDPSARSDQSGSVRSADVGRRYRPGCHRRALSAFRQ